MGRQVKKLSGLEIDEVSLVDRPANQHGLVAIAKREDDDMPPEIFDADGNGVDEEELEHGDVVYDGAGDEFVFIENEVDENEYDEAVGKAGTDLAVRGVASRLHGAKAEAIRWSTGQRMGTRRLAGGAKNAGRNARDAGGRAKTRLGDEKLATQMFAGRKGPQARRAAEAGGQHVNSHRGYYAGGAGAAAGGAAGYNMHKSLGDQVLEELSKSLTDNDRDEVIAKAMDYMEEISKRSDKLEELVISMRDQRENEDFVELAKGYELPIDPEGIGGLMQRASQVLPQEDVATLDRLFSSVGEIAKNGGYDQIGYDGTYESDVLSQVYAVAGEAISKADSSLTQEQAVTALFSANPDAYDEYESEQRDYR